VLAYHLLCWIGKRLEEHHEKCVYQILGIDWKATFPTKKTEIPS
jgi:hypothetical protein